MAHFARVSRDELYASQTLSEENPSHCTRNVAANRNGGAQTFTNCKKPSKARKWVKFELGVGDTTSTTSNQDSPWARDFVPSSPYPAVPSPPASAHSTAAVVKPAPKRKSRRHKKRSTQDMAAKKEQDMYVPPHLRDKAPSAGQVNEATPAENPSESAKASSSPPTAAVRPASPPSPPSTTTPNKKPATNEWGAECGGWDSPKLAQPVRSPPRKQIPRGPARKPIPPKTVWPKHRDMKALPSADEDSDGGICFKSNSNGDPNYDVKKLIDWNGDWMPPPESWSARNAFSDRHFGASIEKWIDGHHESCTADLSGALGSIDYTGEKIEGESVFVDGNAVAARYLTKELAPRTWVPLKIEGDAPQQFWRALPSRAPPALSDVDTNERRPYWEAYSGDEGDCFLSSLVVPTALLDEDDEENRLSRAKMSATEVLFVLKQKKDNRIRKIEARRNRPLPPSPALTYHAPPQLRPEANVYLRPVKASDVEGITEIYNYHIAESISAPEFTPRKIEHMIQRINIVTSEQLPYIVAVAKGNTPRGPRNYVSERIVGFASIDDFCDRGSMYRFTFELELYVHPGYVRKGIAKCLLDRLLGTVSTGYKCKGGYEWVNRGEYLKNDAGRVVKTINISVPHEATEDMDWLNKVLKRFGFRRAGVLHKMGYKKNKIVDITIYQHETSEQIDAAIPPCDPL